MKSTSKKAGSGSESPLSNSVLDDRPTRETFLREDFEEYSNSSLVQLQLPMKREYAQLKVPRKIAEQVKKPASKEYTI